MLVSLEVCLHPPHGIFRYRSDFQEPDHVCRVVVSEQCSEVHGGMKKSDRERGLEGRETGRWEREGEGGKALSRLPGS